MLFVLPTVQVGIALDDRKASKLHSLTLYIGMTHLPLDLVSPILLPESKVLVTPYNSPTYRMDMHLKGWFSEINDMWPGQAVSLSRADTAP